MYSFIIPWPLPAPSPHHPLYQSINYKLILFEISIIFLHMTCRALPMADPWILEPGARYRILGVRGLFDAPLVRVENKIHIVNIACWLQLLSIYLRVLQTTFTETILPKESIGRGRFGYFNSFRFLLLFPLYGNLDLLFYDNWFTYKLPNDDLCLWLI